MHIKDITITVKFKIQAYILYHSDYIFIQTILVLLSVAPTILSVVIVQKFEIASFTRFWVSYLAILFAISIPGILFITGESLFKLSVTGLLFSILISFCAVVFEKIIQIFFNRIERNKIMNSPGSGNYHGFKRNEAFIYDDLSNPAINFIDQLKWNDWIIKNKGNVIYWIILFAMIGGAEEVCFRGIILQTILTNSSGTGKGLLVFLQVLLFGFNHLFFGYKQIIPKLFFGFMLTMVTIQMHTLLPAILSHSLFNAWAIYEPNKQIFKTKKVKR